MSYTAPQCLSQSVRTIKEEQDDIQLVTKQTFSHWTSWKMFVLLVVDSRMSSCSSFTVFNNVFIHLLVV